MPLIFAQPPAQTAPPALSLADAIAAGVKSSSTVASAKKLADASAERIETAAAAGRFSLFGNAQLNRFDAATRVAFGGGAPITVLPANNEVFTLNAVQRIDLFGQVRASVSQARLQNAIDVLNLDTLARQKALSVTVAYYDALRARHQAQVAESSARAAKVQEDIAARLSDAGVGQKIDRLRAETTRLSADQEVERARNSVRIADAAFNDAIGRPLNTPVALVDIPGASVGIDLPAASGEASVTADPLPFTPLSPAPQNINIESSTKTAIDDRSEALIAQTRVRASEIGVELARAGDRPQVSLSATGAYFPTFALQNPRDRTATVSLNVNIPILDGGATRSRVREARLLTESARILAEQTRSEIALEVTRTALDVESAARQVSIANAALAQASAARRLAQIRYAGQVGLFLEVSDAQAALVRAENAQIAAVYDFLIARARFENAVGR